MSDIDVYLNLLDGDYAMGLVHQDNNDSAYQAVIYQDALKIGTLPDETYYATTKTFSVDRETELDAINSILIQGDVYPATPEELESMTVDAKEFTEHQAIEHMIKNNLVFVIRKEGVKK